MDPEDKDFDFAYYIPHQMETFTFYLRRSANAWWLDASKVYRLFDAFDRYDATIEEACSAAGITVRQYKYFADQHPMLNKRRKARQFEKEVDTRMMLAAGIDHGDGALRYLRYTEPEEFDLRCRGPLARLRRQYGVTKKYLEESQRTKTAEEMLEAAEKNIKTPTPKDRFEEHY